MLMKAIADHTYDGKWYKPDDEYEADDPYVETLEALHFARRVEQAEREPPAAKKSVNKK